VLTGAPPVFSAGADLGRGSDPRPPPGQFVRLFARLAATLERLEPPVIAALNGHAVGGAWALALCGDFRFAAEGAQCWVPEIDMGVALHPVLTTPFAAAADYAANLAAKPARALAEVKARINQISRAAWPEVGATTEGVLERPAG
jgi:enoyl-CoA hydratase/carnithine racemase